MNIVIRECKIRNYMLLIAYLGILRIICAHVRQFVETVSFPQLLNKYENCQNL